ncbi:MAG: diguanylate cyclase [Natronospirillum sp.]|uniref:diguanylate cyclase n=1 Tax=Natronospirillum sp. TaxID=2812955 RepID=UPI0025D8A325|nr:diguanylate cyclase [Natronospirillum sp.]MCH8550285.1 diguanylate cyclase [Natronospirillum sp.]
MTNNKTSDSELAAIQQRFAAQLNAELPGIIDLFQHLAGTEADRSLLEDLGNRMHQLAGSAGSFGFSALGDSARVLEQQISQWLNEGLDEGYRLVYRQLATTARQLTELATLDPGSLQKQSGMFEHEPAVPVPTQDRVSIAVLGQRAFLPPSLLAQLQSLNYDIETIASADDLPDRSSDVSPQIVLLDVDRIDPEHPAVKSLAQSNHIAIALSEQNSFSLRKRCVQSGIRFFFPLDADPTRVISHIDQLVRRLNAPPERVMIVEDDDELAGLFEVYLKQAGMDVLVVMEPEECMNQLQHFKPELILMDLRMPTLSGSELAAIIRQHKGMEALPIVFLSGETDFTEQIRAIDIAEADDFLTKPINENRLVASVRTRINRYRQLSELMSRDSLTGLMTHARIKEAIQMETSRARRRGSLVTVAMLDLDNFKSINDQFGHAAGDKVITSMALLLRHALRDSDLKGRYGGEEFVVLLPDSSLHNAVERLEEVRKRFEGLGLKHEGQPFHCTVSIGMACNHAFPGVEGDDLIDHADKALYRAKAAGKNRTVVASPPAPEQPTIRPDAEASGETPA